MANNVDLDEVAHEVLFCSKLFVCEFLLFSPLVLKVFIGQYSSVGKMVASPRSIQR